MQKLILHTLYLFLGIAVLAAILTLVGLAYVWFVSDKIELPYLRYFATVLIGEIIIVTIAIARKGLKYLPNTRTDKNPQDTLRFIETFIKTGTSATIVSNRASWLNDPALIQIFQDKINLGTRIEIILPAEVPADIKQKLNCVSFINTGETVPPEARFTLINGDRSGAEKLAIAKGVHPEHEITIFDNTSGPQIIAMAKDIIRKSKKLANAS